MKKITIPRDIRAAIKETVKHDLMETLDRDIGDYIAHYVGKMNVNLEDEEETVAIENMLSDLLWAGVRNSIHIDLRKKLKSYN